MSVDCLLLPYSLSSYAKIRTGGMLYVDKTRFIEEIEKRGIFYPFIVRPRRFGKTLFTSVLEAYYDKYQADQFESNFSGTYIGQHRTKEQGQYYVLHFDFSAIDESDVLKGFLESLTDGFDNFFSRYPVEEQTHFFDSIPAAPSAYLSKFFRAVRRLVGNRLYIIIDEYDQFANNLLSQNPEQFREATKDNGFIKTFYSQIKKATREDLVSRIFITGVTTISLDSMTSGFSIAKDISRFPVFADLFGFTEQELRFIIRRTINPDRCGMNEDEIFERMKDCYNGYRFSPDSDVTVFNASSCMYYLDALQQQNKEPEPLLDKSIATGPSKLKQILRLGDRSFVENTVTTAIARHPVKFAGFEDDLNLNDKDLLSNNDILAALYYLGYLTYSQTFETQLVCPNKSIETLFIRYYMSEFEDYDNFSVGDGRAKEVVSALRNGNILPLFDFVSDQLTPGTSEAVSRQFDEKNVRTAIKAVAATRTDYRVYEEAEALGKGRTDLMLVPLKSKYPAYLIELKHLKKSAVTEKTVQRKLIEAQEQLDRYKDAANIQTYAKLQRVAAVFCNYTLLKMQAS